MIIYQLSSSIYDELLTYKLNLKQKGIADPKVTTPFIVNMIIAPASHKPSFPLVAESHNLTLFVYKPCDVVFVLF